MLTFIKLGGSLITNKNEAESFQESVMRRVAGELREALDKHSGLRVLLGHGSGSFGHVAAKKHGTMQGVRTDAEWRGFAEVATVARRLNTLVLETLHGAGLPVMSFQPSASAQCVDGAIVSMETAPIRAALEHGIVPLVFGDVSIDAVRGGTIISTETVFTYLADQLQPSRIFLLGEVEGVYDRDKKTIPHITPANLDQYAAALGGSGGTDVTGGMYTKVRDMLALAGRVSGLEIRIFGGTMPGQIVDALSGLAKPGTLITA
jgi:isopentenyl phosphate kinase